MTKYKDPPVMFDPYEEWKKEVFIWENVTTLEKKTQGCALVLSLSGNVVGIQNW